jgi:DNA-binding NarL/FixJ family response regulator
MKILIGEDHPIVRDGIKAILLNDLTIEIDEASNGKEVIDRIAISEPDIAIIDINMPVLDGFATVKHITKYYPRVKVLALSMHDHDNYIAQMFEAGAKGYMLKTNNRDELIYALKKINSGGVYISPEITIRHLHKLLEENSLKKEQTQQVSLSKREFEVLILIAEGLTNNEIADKLFTSRRTIETHRKNLIEKTGSKNTASLIKFAIQNRMV